MSNIIEQSIKHEFETRYLADELENWEQNVPEMAKFSAQQFRYDVGNDKIEETIKLLRAMRESFDHPLVQAAELSYWIDWEEQPQEWRTFQTLLDEIINNLTP